MSKRRQTTGQPKRRTRKSIAPDSSTPQIEKGGQSASYRTRAEREEEIQRWVIRGTFITIGVIAVVVALAFIVDQLIIPNQTVATVGDKAITVSEFRDRVTFERNRINLLFTQQQSLGVDLNQLIQQPGWDTLYGEMTFPDQLGQRVLDDMIDDILIQEEAEARNISINEENVQNEINEFFSYNPTEVALIGVEPTATNVPTETPTPFVSPTPTPLPTATPTLAPEETAEPEATPEPTLIPTLPSPTLSAEEVRENFEASFQDFQEFFRIGNVSDAQIDAFFDREALRTSLRESIGGELESLTYVNARHILVESEEQALDVIDALNNGESFAALAQAVSSDGSSFRGGDLGWSYVGGYVEEFRDAVIEAEVGDIVGPVETQFGFHIIQVRAREERSGEDIEAELETAQNREFQSWLEDTRANNEERIEISNNWTDYVPR